MDLFLNVYSEIIATCSLLLVSVPLFKKNLKRDFCPLHNVETKRFPSAKWVETFGEKYE
jgi:hypothetical protein